MNTELGPQVAQLDLNTFDQLRQSGLNLRTKVGRLAGTVLLLAGGTLAALTTEEAAHTESAIADTTLSYPNYNMPCEHAPYNVTGTCANYDWGPTHTEIYDDPSELSSRGYAYRNCTDYVAWKEGTIGVTVPRTWENGGQWYDKAPAAEKSTSPAAWDAAVELVSSAHPDGHVAFIESVNSVDTTNPDNDNITVSEYNHDEVGGGDTRTGTAASMGFTKFVDFGVHPSPAPSAPSHRSIGDFNGDGITDLAVFRPSDGTWHINGVGDFSYGQSGDIPVPGNYDSAHPSITDIAVFRPSDDYWHIRGVGDFQYGDPGDIPVPGDYNGDGVMDIAVYRPSDGTWHIRGVGDYSYGETGDIPVPGYYNNDNVEDMAVYRPSEGGWHIRGVGDFPYGASTDIPVPGDYNGDGLTDAAVFRPSEGGWHINGVGDDAYGASTDIPVPGFYNSDASEDIAVYRPSEGGWHINGVGDFAYGASTDIPAVQTLNAFLLKQYGLISGF